MVHWNISSNICIKYHFFCVSEGLYSHLEITDQSEHMTDPVNEELHKHGNDYQNILFYNVALEGLQYHTLLIYQ